MEENGGQTQDQNGVGKSTNEHPSVGEVGEAQHQHQIEAATKTENKAENKAEHGRGMKLRHKWNKTSLPNKLNTVLTAVIVLLTLVNVGFFIKQVRDQDAQVTQVANAITNGSANTKDAVKSALEQGNITLSTSLKENRDALTKSLDAIKRDADASLRASLAQGKEALDASIAASRLDQRAWVGFVESNNLVFKVGSKATVNHVFTNTGKTPGIDLKGRVDSVALPSGEEFAPIYHPLSSGPSISIIMPNQRQDFRADSSSTVWIQVNSDSVASGSTIVYFFGELCYRDIFQRQHHTTFCEILLPDMVTTRNCRTYNTADDDPHEYCTVNQPK